MFWVFAVTGFAELGALVAIGETTMSLRAAVIIGVMVLWLGRGSRAAWWVFVIANALALVMTSSLVVGSSSGPGRSSTAWGNVAVLSVGSVALLAILLSPTMRESRRAAAASSVDA